MSNANAQDYLPFKEEDIEELLKAVSHNKTVTTDRGSKKILVELAQTFLEEVLDLTPSEKQTPTVSAISRHIAIKFPEIAKETINFTADYLQRRGIEIEKEEMN